MHPKFVEFAEQCTIDIETFDHEKFADMIVNHMMVHLAAHALSHSTAMDVYVQWTEMYEGKIPERQPLPEPRDIDDNDF
jgi:hypothetical protein